MVIIKAKGYKYGKKYIVGIILQESETAGELKAKSILLFNNHDLQRLLYLFRELDKHAKCHHLYKNIESRIRKYLDQEKCNAVHSKKQISRKNKGKHPRKTQLHSASEKRSVY